ncbi:MAG: hypothetical protein H8E44_11330 [Planctomycetes bacterium]|nr:hypothetical protein [Planctomycetota bacterium]MBL7039838.1 hypothetical protein [Pirellulaceae bacterium]
MTRNGSFLVTLSIVAICVCASTTRAQFRPIAGPGSSYRAPGNLGAGLGSLGTSFGGGPTPQVGKITLESSLPSVSSVQPEIPTRTRQSGPSIHDRRAVPPPPPKTGRGFVPPIVPEDESKDENRVTIIDSPPANVASIEKAEDPDCGWGWAVVLAVVVIGWFAFRQD